ncbi:MAG: glutathione S-transferase [Kordiimonadaceae bacterium]|nr:glutathione S-transferase [Kordiimonadaceae bacterium]MBO6568834.1 glutathione S-transferase [Kordiimonadaceae bacterium]MBO6965191.1 glutathione S-transferase [Kordiimonadaceae bacterium]
MSDTLPVLYSFRRCPYAMRARMAVAVAGIAVNLREVVLRDKPPSMLEASAKGTVPVLVLDDGAVIDESLDVMRWALAVRDPEGWLGADETEASALISENDGSFKHHLDRFKYATRYEGADPLEHRMAAESFLLKLNDRLSQNSHLLGERRSFADIAIFPFIRQFANAAGDFMQDERFASLMRWLNDHVQSDLFLSVMKKYPQWHAGEAGQAFPD